MSRSRCWLLLSALVALGIQVGVAQTRTVQRIEIVSTWGSPDSPRVTRVVIQNEGGVYRRDREQIAPGLIDRFASSLDEPTMTEPSLTGIDITQDWLESNVDQATASMRGSSGGPRRNSLAQKALFRTTFTRPASLAPLLKLMFACSHTDDYPTVEIVLSYTTGGTKRASSSSQCAFMLPWSVTGEGAPTFNAHVSRAVAALMPPNATNYQRLSGDTLVSDLADHVLHALEDELNMLDVENRAPGVLDRLRTRFVVHTAEINEFHHLTYGTPWDRPTQEHETNLHATLHTMGSPANLTTSLVLRAPGEQVEGIEGFLAAEAKYEQRALSIPWLRVFLDEFPQVPVRIAYVQNASVGDKALRIFTADMVSLGRTDLAREVSAYRNDAALLMVGLRYFESYWLVLPDNRLILWRHRGPSGLLRWKPEDFRGRRCTEYQQLYEECIGAVVTSDGRLRP